MREKLAPPYYIVIFTSIRTNNNEGYEDTARQMIERGTNHPGCLGFESVAEGEKGISLSYWKDLDSIADWKHQEDHILAQNAGREKWYKSYHTRIALVKREYSFGK